MSLPKGLGADGMRLWAAVHDDLAAVTSSAGETWELDARELIVLEAAARQADLNAALEAAIDRDGVIVTGSQGQSRLNAVATELRQGRIALEKLLSTLALPTDAGQVMTASQRRAQTAARARWGVR